MCVNMHVNMCVNMRVNMCVNMCVNMETCFASCWPEPCQLAVFGCMLSQLQFCDSCLSSQCPPSLSHLNIIFLLRLRSTSCPQDQPLQLATVLV